MTREQAIAEILRLMQEFGITLEELIDHVRYGPDQGEAG